MRCPRSSRATAALLCLFALYGCGAKTQLRVPGLDGGFEPMADAQAPIEESTICVEPRPGVESLVVDLSLRARVGATDVVFVIDRTGSMGPSIDNVRRGLLSVIIPGLRRSIADLRVGLVSFSDFPIVPFGGASARDTVFTLEQAATSDFSRVEAKLQGIVADGGGDGPEALVEALYQVATGDGVGASTAQPLIDRAPACDGVGYTCVRRGARPIVLAVTDAPSHNGPRGAEAYDDLLFPPGARPHRYDETAEALRRIGAKVIGIDCGIDGSSGRPHLEALARDTMSVNADGSPLVFSVGNEGAGLSEEIVRAIERYTSNVRLDVSARVVSGGLVDGSLAVRQIRPSSAAPMSNVARIEGDTFYGVVPGTQLRFDVVLDRALVPVRAEEQRVEVRVEFLDHGTTTLEFRDLTLVIPGTAMMQRCP